MTNIFYYSNKSTPCSTILQELEKIPHIRTTFQYICIDNTNPSHNISCIPAVILDNKILQGKQVFEWLEKEKNDNTLPAFEVGFGNTNFSSIQDSNSSASNNFNFTYIDENSNMPSSKTKNCNKSRKIEDNALDDLINQRKADIPMIKPRS